MRNKLFWVSLVGGSLLSGSLASALPVGEYNNKLSDQDAGNYVTGAVSMMSYYHGGEKGKCINDWFFRTKDSTQEVIRMMIKAEERDPALHVEGVLLGLIKRHCGHLDQKGEAASR